MAISFTKKNLDRAVEWVMRTSEPGTRLFLPGVPGNPKGMHFLASDKAQVRDFLKGKVARVFNFGTDVGPKTFEKIHPWIAVSFEPHDGLPEEPMGSGDVTDDVELWLLFGAPSKARRVGPAEREGR